MTPPPLPASFRRPKRPGGFFTVLIFVVLSPMLVFGLPIVGYIAWVRLVVCKDVLVQTMHSGLDFEIWQTGCDPDLSVFVSYRGHDRTEILTMSYNESYNEDLPLIDFHPDEKRIEIAVSRMNDIIYKVDRWTDMTVEYHAKVDNPRPGSETTNH
jgi:hypothetical protein